MISMIVCSMNSKSDKKYPSLQHLCLQRSTVAGSSCHLASVRDENTDSSLLRTRTLHDSPRFRCAKHFSPTSLPLLHARPIEATNGERANLHHGNMEKKDCVV